MDDLHKQIDEYVKNQVNDKLAEALDDVINKLIKLRGESAPPTVADGDVLEGYCRNGCGDVYFYVKGDELDQVGLCIDCVAKKILELQTKLADQSGADTKKVKQLQAEVESLKEQLAKEKKKTEHWPDKVNCAVCDLEFEPEISYMNIRTETAYCYEHIPKNQSEVPTTEDEPPQESKTTAPVKSVPTKPPAVEVKPLPANPQPPAVSKPRVFRSRQCKSCGNDFVPTGDRQLTCDDCRQRKFSLRPEKQNKPSDDPQPFAPLPVTLDTVAHKQVETPKPTFDDPWDCQMCRGISGICTFHQRLSKSQRKIYRPWPSGVAKP